MTNLRLSFDKVNRQLNRGEAGSALVETALTFPILILMLLGAVDLGDIAFKAIEVTGAARAAAQYAAMNGGNYMDTRTGGGIDLAARNEAPRATTNCTSFTVTQPTAPTCACSGGGGACSGTAAAGTWACATGKTVVTVYIATTAVCPGIVGIPGLSSGGFTLHGYAEQKVLQ
jgi:Flp pilus assembly protein TadG